MNIERRELHSTEKYYVCGNSEKNFPCVDRDGSAWRGEPTTPMPVTPLIGAAGRGNLEATRLLLEAGADFGESILQKNTLTFLPTSYIYTHTVLS